MPLPDDFLPLIDIPEPLRGPLGHTRQRLAEALSQADNLAEMSGRDSPLEDWLGLSEARREELARVLAISDFVAETLVRYPEWLLHLDRQRPLGSVQRAGQRHRLHPLPELARGARPPGAGP